MTPISYNDALDLLYGYINYELQRQDRYSPDVMTLERPEKLMALLGNPEKRYPTLHLTGTKGKGSVGAMSASVLQAAGYRVGLYSSPHLQDFRERFQINQELISHEDFAEVVYDLKPVMEQVEGLTWFEAITAVAFEYFARQKVDIAVIEVGLGGRLDATNVLRPLASMITSLSFDHTYLLGNTLAAIAGEKAGIIKEGVPVISAPQPAEAQAVLERIAAERHAPFTLIGRDIPYTVYPESINGQAVTVVMDGVEKVYRTALMGQHQAINTTVVLAAIQKVREAGIAVPEAAIHAGLQNVNWPGRLEVVQNNPLLVLDSAHNRASAQCLRNALSHLFGVKSPVILVFGAKGDKDIQGMMEELLSITDEIIITQAVDSRAESPTTIVDIVRATGYGGNIHVMPVVGEAIQQALQLAGNEGMVCVTGSLYVVGEARTMLGLAAGKALMPSSILKTSTPDKQL